MPSRFPSNFDSSSLKATEKPESLKETEHETDTRARLDQTALYQTALEISRVDNDESREIEGAGTKQKEGQPQQHNSSDLFP